MHRKLFKIWSQAADGTYLVHMLCLPELLLVLTPKKDVLFIIEDWNAKVESQETPGVTGKFGLGIQNEARQRLIEFCKRMLWS